jgi:hypothetical protein
MDAVADMATVGCNTWSSGRLYASVMVLDEWWNGRDFVKELLIRERGEGDCGKAVEMGPGKYDRDKGQT